MASYDSTARALALPVSPLESPAISHHPVQTPWTRRSSQMARNQSFSGRREASFQNNLRDSAEKLQRQLVRSFKKLTPLQKVLFVVAHIGVAVVGILFLIFNERIFAWLEPIAEKWKNLRGGWVIIWVMTFATAFPPLLGYSSCVAIAGFVFGFPNGWFIVASATVAGSLCSFIVSRTILSRFVQRLVEKNPQFVALSLVLKHDGLKLLCMIRLCPLPYSISNGAMSTFATVKPLSFALATAIVTPKLMVHIFIGTRLAAIAKSGEKMDAGTKAINWASIIAGGIIGALTGWFIYKRTLARSQELEAEERNGVRNVVSRNREFSDDSEAQAATATLLRDDQIDFLDQGDGRDEYRDEYTDDEDNDFRFGDGDEEGAIGLNRQSPKR